MDRLHHALMPLMLVAGFFLGCGGNQTQTSPTAAGEAPQREGQGTVRLNVSFALWGPEVAKIADLQSIDDATVYVYASDGAEILRRELTLSEGRATGELTAPAAEDLRVVLVFYDDEIVRYVGADDDVDVTIGGETTADLLCHYQGTWVRAPEIAGVNRPYTVTWASRPHATGYELQESASAEFLEPLHLYEGTAASHQVSGKSEVGATYYYRARAGTGYGVGPWHSTGAAAVEIHKAEGKIVIDVPIPPDEPERPPDAVYFGDDFNDNVIDPGKWRLYEDPAFVGTTSETNQELQVSIAPGTSGNPKMHLCSQWMLRGDFDIQVDFRLIEWRPDSFNVGLMAGLQGVVQLNSSHGDQYLTHFSDRVHGYVPLEGDSGKLRLVRTGTTIAGFGWVSGEWVWLHSGPGTAADEGVFLHLWGDAESGGVVAFDNFSINDGEVIETAPPGLPGWDGEKFMTVPFP